MKKLNNILSKTKSGSQYSEPLKDAKPTFFELRSINLWGMREKEQEEVLERFVQFLNALTKPTTLRIVEDSRNVRAGSTVYENARYKRYFIEANSDVEAAVSMIGASYEEVSSIPKLSIVGSSSRYLIDDSLNFVQVLNVTRLGGRLPTGFLSQAYGVAHEVRVEIDPIRDLFRAKRLVNDRIFALGETISYRRSRGWLIGPDLVSQRERLERIANELSSSSQRLFRVRTKFVLRAPSLESLLQKKRLLGQALSSFVEEVDSPAYVQMPLYTGSGPNLATGRWFYVPTETLGVFFPFAGLDLTDPSGTLIGENLLTHNVVLYDVYEKENYNIALIGSTGSGKSTLIKSWVSRMALENPEMVLFTFDALDKKEYSAGPDGKFESSFASKTGSSLYVFRQSEKAGLDPFKIYLEEDGAKPDTKAISEFISTLLNQTIEPSLRTDLKLACEKSTSFEELLQNSSPSLLKQLQADLGPYMFLLEGEPIQLYSRTCFVLSLLPEWAKDVAQFLAFSYSWQIISRLPENMKKLVVVDEGWRLVSPAASGRAPTTSNFASTYVPKIARTGRHYNCAFILATQLARDFFSDNSIGRPMIESCATKIVLRQDEAASDLLSSELALGHDEQRFIQKCSQGQGLLVTPEGKVQFYNLLSDEEKMSFTRKLETI